MVRVDSYVRRVVPRYGPALSVRTDAFLSDDARLTAGKGWQAHGWPVKARWISRGGLEVVVVVWVRGRGLGDGPVFWQGAEGVGLQRALGRAW